MTGEVQPLDISPRARGYQGMWKRVPVGPCSFISPFNFPLNLAAHKIAPALAVGCPFVMKPASRTPLGALIIGEVLAETDLPAGAFSILPAHRDGADLFTTDDRLKLLSFTGSPDVGWDLKARAGKKRVVLELGGNAAVIIDQGCRSRRCGRPHGFRGVLPVRPVVHRGATHHRSCRASMMASRRPAVDADAGADARATLQRRIDLHRPDDRCKGSRARLDRWIVEARAAGATLLCGGNRDCAMLDATLLEGVPRSASNWPPRKLLAP
jgi:acyl-CoA reductase-like NAD-dependent aldehyde dehydrogenase